MQDLTRKPKLDRNRNINGNLSIFRSSFGLALVLTFDKINEETQKRDAKKINGNRLSM